MSKYKKMYISIKRYIPSKAMRQCNIGDIEIGVDGNKWIVNSIPYKNKKGEIRYKKKWLKVKTTVSSDDDNYD